MRPTEQATPPPGSAVRPRWSEVLRALRAARGVTQAGWAAQLSVSRKTVLRWEAGERVPDPGAEAAILTYCRERNLFRTYDRGPLAGLAVTAELLQDLLAEARWRADAALARRPPAGARPAGTPHDTPHPPLPGLPAQLSSFVGRERELAAVRRLQAGRRLLTLTGAGGCGKTRLALALAEQLLRAYPDGVWFVDAAPLADPALLPQTVAAALAVRPAGQQPATEALCDALRPRRLLLLLDNCEHLLVACAELVAALLRACPHLEVVATSREALGIIGETVWRVPPMSVPGSGFLAPGSDGQHREPGTRNRQPGEADAARLFVERARLRRPEFELTVANATAVVEVCRRLEGIPLAIELAAARVAALSVEQIAARLEDRLGLLTAGNRTALPRHQTLRAALDWSHDLLTPDEQALLRRLSVFAGGFTLEAADAVTEGVGQGGGRSAPDCLDLLARLVDKSLVVAEERGEAVRYRMLETVRQYAAERLAAAGEARAVQERQALWCLGLAELAETHKVAPDQDRWLERLAAEHDNMRAALAWCLAGEDGAVFGLRLGGALGWFWTVRGHYAEGRRWLAALLARAGRAPPDVRAKALDRAGWLAQQQGDYDEAEGLNEQALALRRELGDEAGIASMLSSLGILAGMRGDYVRAWAVLEECLALTRTLGDRQRVAGALMNLGITARRLGEFDRAVDLYEECLPLGRDAGDMLLVANTLLNLGNLHGDLDQPEPATARYRESLAIYRALQDRLGAARCLGGLAEIAGKDGDARRAARLCGAADGLREAIGAPLPPNGRAAFDRTVAAARATLGEAEFSAVWAAGAALPLDDAIDEAVAEASPA